MQDEDAFFADYAEAHMRLSELGWVFISEIEYSCNAYNSASREVAKHDVPSLAVSLKLKLHL